MHGSEASQLHIRSSAPLRLRTFGTALVERDGRPVEGPAQQRRVLALLAIIAAAGDGGISRDRVLALLWSEGEPERARQALAQTLYHARRSLGDDELFLTSPTLRLNPAVMSADVGEFQRLLDAGETEQAVALYQGDFMEGFHIAGAPEFEHWASSERARLGHLCARALGELASAASARGEFAEAVEWRRRRAALDPFNSRAALELITAMAEAGDRAGALRHAQLHETLLRTEFDVGLDAALAEFVEQLRTEPSRATATTATADATERVDESARGHQAALDDESLTVSAEEVAARGDGVAAEPEAPLTPGPVGTRETAERPWSAIAGRRRVWLAAAVGIAVVGLAAAVVAAVRANAGDRAAQATAPPPADMIVVAPFRVSGADPALAYLHEGMIDLLVTKLTEDDAADAADAGAVMSAWRSTSPADADDVAGQDALRVAAKLGASRVILGSVVGTPKQMVLSASVLDVRSGRVRAQATVAGTSDSLTVIVDQLAARLLADEAGVAERLANHTTTSLAALRPFLLGQAAYRRGSYREAIDQFRTALQRDATFSMAGLGLAQAAHRIGDGEEFARGVAAAWPVRAELTDPDRLYLEALAGPRYPARSSKREMLSAWEQAVVDAPNRPGVWLELGERFFHDGRLLGVRDWAERATAALRRATQLAPSLAAPTQYLLHLAAEHGDTAGVRQLDSAYAAVDSTGDLAAFVRWRSALALADRPRLSQLRRSSSTMTAASLKLMALATDYELLAPGDGDAALSTLRSRSARRADRADALMGRHAFELNGGRPARAAAALAQLEDMPSQAWLALRLRVAAAIYGGADTTAVTAAAQRLFADSASAGADRASNVCVAGQWHAWRGDWADAARAVAELGASGPDGGAPKGPACAALIEATVATRQRGPDAARLLQRVESLLVSDPHADELLPYGYLAVARLRAALGDTRGALATVRRRPHMEGWSPFVTSQTLEEGNLALALGDTAAAVGAFRQVQRRRPSPENGVEPSRATLESLIARLDERDSD
jgi:DNA-binding SARP family transcriptional activator